MSDRQLLLESKLREGLKVENAALRARVAEAEARAQQAEAENGRLREALQLANRILYEHHNAAYKLDWGMVCQICKESGVFETIDAALAAQAPETGEREAAV